MFKKDKDVKNVYNKKINLQLFLGFIKSLWDEIRGAVKILRVRIFLSIVIISWIPFLIFSSYVFTETMQTRIDEKISDMQYQARTLSRQMTRSAYFINMDSAGINYGLNSEINILADIFNGRIVIVDESFKIVKDTYNIDTEKYNISEIVLKTINSSSEQYKVYSKRRYAEFTIPIYDQSLENIKGVMVCSLSSRDIIDSINESWNKYQIIEVAICILIAVVAFFISGSMLKPLKTLKTELNRANQGDMEPISVPDYHETEEIAAVYNESLLRLKHLDESRQEFVSNVSHELKTPITSVRVLADSLLSMGDDVPTELYKEFMTDISNEIERESRIIDDLLEMVRLDRNNAVLNIVRINMNELVEGVLRRLKGLAELRNIDITLECMHQVEADIDELKITRVITNLVENAIKYNKDGGSVSVVLNADQTYFYIKIVDTGVGIPEDEIGKVFERFYRVDKARSRETGGTGLGLAICKNIVQLHHGIIRVSSDYGSGSTFMVRIPLIYIE